MTALYVHIPFCLVHCPYCDFNAYSGMEDLAESYVAALLDEIGSRADGSKVGAVFFGGGTPTRLPAAVLAGVLSKLRESFELNDDVEVTVEANPDDLTEPYSAELLEAGFNRLSIGVQSLDDSVLKRLGRAHTGAAGPAAIRAARTAGFARTSADLIFGTPGESLAGWEASLRGVIEAGVHHISCYALTIEEGTPFASWVARGVLPPPDDDDQADKYELAHRLLAEGGYVRYEVSNWSRPCGECRYNLGCWHGDDYLGFGAGAHSHRSGRRWWNAKNPRTYIALSPEATDGEETLDTERRRAEELMLGLRTAYGVPQESASPQLERLIEDGLLERAGGRIRPTDRGFLLNNRIAMEVLSTPNTRVLT